MRRILSILFCLVLSIHSASSFAQSESRIATVEFILQSDTLPGCEIVSAPEDFLGVSIKNNEYVKGRLLKKTGENIVFDSGDYIDANGNEGVRIRIRGNSSATLKFPHYKVKLNKKNDLLGKGCKDKNWCLMKIQKQWPQRFYVLNNIMASAIASLATAEWQPSFEYVRLYINGEFRGLYMISDAIERNEKRVDIEKSGFIIEADAMFWNSDSLYFKTENQDHYLGYTFKYPDVKTADDSEIAKTKEYMDEIEREIYGTDEILEGKVDVPSFAHWLLAHDILGIGDNYGSNIYCVRENAESPLKMGPLWDFDTVGYIEDSWVSHHGNNAIYMKELLRRKIFVDEYIKRWGEIKDSLLPLFDSVTDSIKNNFGEELDQLILENNAKVGEHHPTLSEHIAHFRSFLENRISWIDGNIQSLYNDVQTPEAIEDIKTETSNHAASKLFTIDGRRIVSSNSLVKGIYIKNGKKFLVK